MNQNFESYFQARMRQLREVDPSVRGLPPLPPQISSALSASEATILKAIQIKALRADAQLLLYLAFKELVALPLIAVHGQDIDLDLQQILEEDIDLITNGALEQRTAENLASAHDIVNATSTSWEDLRSSSWDLWD